MHHLDWVAPFCVGVLLFVVGWGTLWVITRSWASSGVLFRLNQKEGSLPAVTSAHLACCVVSISACSVCGHFCNVYGQAGSILDLSALLGVRWGR